jgi:Dolichyl-phosphate-mannose-protein mannosyltransferase
VEGLIRRTDEKHEDRRFLPALVGVFLLFPSLIWIARDHRVWPWDQAYYAMQALKIQHAWSDGFPSWLWAFLDVPDSRAPLLVWLAQTTSPLVGSAFMIPERAYLLINIAAAVATLCLVFSAARLFTRDTKAAVAAMLLCGSSASFIALNHQFFVEGVQTTTMAAMIWIAAQAHRLSSLRFLAGITGSVALAMLAKTTSVGFTGPFVVYVVTARLLTFREPRAQVRPLDYALALGALTIAALSMTWYARHQAAVIAHMIDSSDSEIALLFGSSAPLLTKLGFWLDELLIALSPFKWLAGTALSICVLGIGIVLANVVARPAKEWMSTTVSTGLLFSLYLAGTILLGLLAYSWQINQAVRFLAPMIPFVAVLFGWSIAALRQRWLVALSLVALSFNAAETLAFAHGFVIVPVSTIFHYVQRPINDFAGIQRLSRAVHETCDKNRAPHVSIIGAELPTFNAVSAWFYAEKMRGDVGFACSYSSLGYAYRDINLSIKLIYDADADYLATLPLDQLPAPERSPFNRVTKPVAKWIAASRDFDLVTADDSLVIYRRRR